MARSPRPVPPKPEPSPQEIETRRLAKAVGNLTRLILENRDDWMLSHAEMLGVMAYVAAYLTAELATEPQLRDRIADAEAVFLEVFKKHFAASIEAKKMMRFL